MTVKELQKILRTMPPNARVFHLWDSEPRTPIDYVYLSKTGHVITSAYGQYCSNPNYHPVGVFNENWKVPNGEHNKEDDLDF